MTSESGMAAFVVDVGKSGTRAHWRGRRAETAGLAPEGAGVPGAGETLARVVLEAGENLAVSDPARVVVGSTFLPLGAELQHCATALSRAWPTAEVFLAEDGVLAHAAALGRPGTVASVGTGVIVVGMTPAGTVVRVDGWGPDLGDRGSAWALGLAGLRKAMAMVDEVVPLGPLHARASDFLGALDLDTVTALLAAPDRVSRVASFAEQVCASAEDGDDLARGLVDRSADDVASSCAAVARRVGLDAVVVTGRLCHSPAYRDALQSALVRRGLICQVDRAEFDERTADAFSTPAYRAACAAVVDQRSG